MSSAEATVQLQEELSCSICFQCFQEPVSIHCGHSFCRACITTYWNMGKKKSFSCPRCRETSQKKFLRRNQDLKNVVGIVSKLIVKEEGVCKRHQEPLKLFCKDDRTPICVVCDRSKEHQNHAVLPLEEAMQDYKRQMQVQLESVRKEKDKLLGLKAMGAARSKETLEMIRSGMQKTASAFQQTHRLLDEQQQVQVAQWKSLQAAVEEEQEEQAARLSRDISQLDRIIAGAEGKWWLPEEVNITLTRFKNRTRKPVPIFPELEQRLDFLIRQNVVTAQTLRKFEDSLALELGNVQLGSPEHVPTSRDVSPFKAEKDESSSLAAKRRKLMHPVDPAGNRDPQQSPGDTECPWQLLDSCSGGPSAPAPQPAGNGRPFRDEDKSTGGVVFRHSAGTNVKKDQQARSFLQCSLS